jgi:hypothetical protein
MKSKFLLVMGVTVAAALGVAAAGCAQMSHPAAQEGKAMELNWEFLKSFVPAYNRVWTAPPLVGTTDTVYAPVMGNGNMSVCLSGDNDTQVYYMRTADFWTDDGESDGRYHDTNVGPATGDGLVREIPSGCLRIGVAKQDAPPSPPGQAVGYRQEEDILDAETSGVIRK